MTKKADESSMHLHHNPTSNSYLVRVWQESEATDLRFYLRDLKTGEERYLGDLKQIGELLTRGLDGKATARPGKKETA